MSRVARYSICLLQMEVWFCFAMNECAQEKLNRHQRSRVWCPAMKYSKKNVQSFYASKRRNAKRCHLTIVLSFVISNLQ